MSRPKTRQRILDASLELFNSHGEGNVTTNEIANELDMSPGNLHYHFKRKRDIVTTLFSAFHKAMEEVLVDPGDRSLELEDLWFYLHLVFETIGQYRFIYRDVNDLLHRHETLQGPFSRLLVQQRASASAICNALQLGGIMEIDELDKLTLVNHILMTITFWIPFSEIDSSGHGRSAALPGRAIYQVISLAIPYLREPERQLARQLALSYME
nr:putative TetR/AcrR family transcriptional regulator [uncultured bacterium]